MRIVEGLAQPAIQHQQRNQALACIALRVGIAPAPALKRAHRRVECSGEFFGRQPEIVLQLCHGLAHRHLKRGHDHRPFAGCWA
jgi:hypothetical protein